MARDVLLAAAGARQRELLVEIRDLLEKPGAVAPVRVGADVELLRRTSMTAAYNAMRDERGQGRPAELTCFPFWV